MTIEEWLANNPQPKLEDYKGKLYGTDKYNADLEAWQMRYNVMLQQLQHEREDDAYQRKAKDLEAAGLSKTLAAGGSGSAAGTVVPTTAPKANRNVQTQKMQQMTMGLQTAKSTAEIFLMSEQAKKLQAESEYTKSRTKGQDIGNFVDEQLKNVRVDTEKASKEVREFEIEIAKNTARKAQYEQYMKWIESEAS